MIKKNYKFKCIRYDRHDYDGYTGEMEVYTLDGIYLKGQKYCSKVSKENESSKYNCKKDLFEFIQKYEKEIEQDLARIRGNRSGFIDEIINNGGYIK